LLFSALLQLGFGPERQGFVEISATWTTEAGDAYMRAMSRVEDPRSDDTRSSGQRDCDRFVAVAMQVLRAVEESSTRRGSSL
jgi:hypothetical protein